MSKLILFFLLLLLIVYSAKSQNYLFIGPYSGSNLQGRLATSGSSAEISISSRTASSFIENPTNGERWSIYSDGNLKFWTGADKIIFTREGNLCLGPVVIPYANANGRLSVSGNSAEVSLSSRSVNSFIQNPTNGERWSIYNQDGLLRFWTGNDKVVISKDGRVGIGTTNLTEQLAVNGKIKCEELQVVVDVADYVFEEDYKLMSLEEVETYIKVNKHLPGVPGKDEIHASGFAVGQMTNKVLEKVEELTLYLIELKRENKQLKKENEVLIQLEERIKYLEEKLK